MRIVLLCLLFLSFSGYFLWIKSKYDIHEAFIPLLIVTSIGSRVFVAGILNIMPIIVMLIFGGGIFQLRYIKTIRKCLGNRSTLVNVGLYLITCIVLAFMLRNNFFTHYDNFSHWALVVKDILQNDRLPNFESPNIRFPSYPTGTAGFIYYVCKFIGVTEGCMAFAQALIVISCIYTLIAFLEGRNRYLFLLVGYGSIYLLNANIPLTELLVDTVIALLGFAGIAMVYYYREQINLAILLLAPVVLFLVCVKSSGMFFLLVDVLFVLYIAKQQKQMGLLWKKIIGFLVLVPFGITYLWNCHVKQVFPTDMEAKHAVSIRNYEKVFGEKTRDDIWNITRDYWKEVFSIQNEVLWLFMLLLLVLCASAYINQKKNGRYIVARNVGLCVGVYVSYMVSLYMMYLLSMPLYEAINLAGYNRYNMTFAVFLYAIVLFCVLIYLPAWSRKQKRRAMLLCVYVLVMLPTIPHMTKVSYKDTTFRKRIIRWKEKRTLEEGKRYLVYLSDAPYTEDYIEYVVRYELGDVEVVVCNQKDVKGKCSDLEEYGYLLIYEKDAIIDNILYEHGLPMDKRVIRMKGEKN